MCGGAQHDMEEFPNLHLTFCNIISGADDLLHELPFCSHFANDKQLQGAQLLLPLVKHTHIHTTFLLPLSYFYLRIPDDLSRDVPPLVSVFVEN